MSQNTLMHDDGEMHFDKYKPEDVEPALKHYEDTLWQRINNLLKIENEDRDFDNTVLALTGSGEEFYRVVLTAMHLNMVLGEAWEEAALLADEISTRVSNEVDFHQGIYQALLSLESKTEYIKSLSKPKQKLLSDLIRGYKRRGIELPKTKQQELKDIYQKLSKLSLQFEQNIVKADDVSGVLVDNADALEGLDQDFIDSCKQDAEEKNLNGYWIQYSQPNYKKVMSECKIRSTRQKLYEVHISNTEELNKSLSEEILQLRQKVAEILGYENYADYILEDRMAKKLSTVREFIDKLRNYYQDKALAETEELEKFAQQLENDDKLKLEASDIDTGIDFYYAMRMREHQNSINFAEIEEYFPLDLVLETMFDTLSTLYNVKFEPIKEATWHKDVDTYAIKDLQNGNHLAIVWCDWYARKGKRTNAWMNSIYSADRAERAENRPHLGLVCANLNSPKADKPSLMSLRDIETVWHEFGHFMHLALSNTELREQDMMDCLWDFVEAPSQIMENWVWQPEIMVKMSKHYKTGKHLPQETIDKLINDRNFMVGNKAMRQLSLSDVDIKLHTEFNSSKDSFLDFARNIKNTYLTRDVYPQDSSITAFSHILAGGYACGYYSYKWAESIEADLFTRFEKEGVLNPKVGMAYRQEVLSRGNEERPEVLVKDFLGRDSSMDAMLKRDGIEIS